MQKWIANVIQKFIQKLRLFLENCRFWKMENKPQDASKNDLFSRRFIFCILSIIILKVKRHNYFLTQRFPFWVRKWSYILQKMMQKNRKLWIPVMTKKSWVFNFLIFWLMKINSNYEELLFKPITLSENGSFLNKQLTIAISV